MAYSPWNDKGPSADGDKELSRSLYRIKGAQKWMFYSEKCSYVPTDSAICSAQNTSHTTERLHSVMEWTTTQKIILFVVVLVCLNYATVLFLDRLKERKCLQAHEGFEDAQLDPKTEGLYTWIRDVQEIYDPFYAGVYDQLTNQVERTQAKTKLLMNIWKDSPKLETKPEQWSVLDVGCGTGHAALSFVKSGTGKVVGLDVSPAMLKEARTKCEPQYKLTDKQSNALSWRKDLMQNPSACQAGEFTHIVCFYFTFYYSKDQEELFRIWNLWTKPGGQLAVEVVNKHKFDPLLESASPFLGFSLQKYSKERLKKSNVAFDKFEYQADFSLVDPKAEFYETFRFKNGVVRRQKHEFYMPTMDAIVAMAKRAGWQYVGYQDLLPLGFEYGYILTFEK
jgi:ubiquinone/menaquinone biosynthesis C-methylase UbiE